MRLDKKPRNYRGLSFETVIDSKGRVTLGKEIVKRYGTRFFIIQVGNDIVLIPTSKGIMRAKAKASRLLKEYNAIAARAKNRRVHGDSAAVIREDRDSR